MELWHKLLTYRKKNDQNKFQKTSTEKCESPCASQREGAPFKLQKDGIRVLLFRDCDTRGRKLLYDSKTVVRVPFAEIASAGVPSCKNIFKNTRHSGLSVTSSASVSGLSPSSSMHHSSIKSSTCNARSTASSSSSKSDGFQEINGGYGYQYQHPESDTKQLGDLIFGTVALSYRGSCSKLHQLQNPQRVLLSRISPAPRSYTRPSCTSSDQGIEDSSFGSSLSSLSETVISRTESLDLHLAHGGGSAWAVDMPHMLSTSHSEGDSGFGGPPSPYGSTCGSFLSPPSFPNTPLGTPSSKQGSGNSLKHSGSLNSLQRRFLRNVTTSLEALGRDGEMLEDSVTSSGHHSHRVTRLGLAVILNMGSGYTEMSRQVEDWLFLHHSIIEASLNKLQANLEAAYLHPRTFVSTTYQAVLQLQQDMLDLVGGPKLCHPVWLGLLGKSAPSDRQILCTRFVDALSSVLNTFDTKQTNFFVSKLLTAVLTYHLGWVSTVAPNDYQSPTPRSVSSSRSESYSSPFQSTVTEDTPSYHANLVEHLNESHPYCAVWAQLCELSGAVGYPPRAARTVLVGSNSQLLSQLLTILSYIIRCSQILEQDLQSYNNGENPSPERQPCFSRTSSVASVVTIVDGGQPQSAKLHRDPSIRRSWRMSRENRGSRLYQHECRVSNNTSSADIAVGIKGHGSGDECLIGSTADGTLKVQQARSSRNHTSCKKDKEGSSKWMLNDDVEIIIGEEKPLETKESSDTSNKCLPHASATEKTMSTCKTSTNLALLINDDSDSSLSVSVPDTLDKQDSRNFTKLSSEGLYPSLLDLDDHRETFGTMSLEPSVINEKVQKLFRMPYKCNNSQESCSSGVLGVQSSSSVLQHHSSSKDNVLKSGKTTFGDQIAKGGQNNCGGLKDLGGSSSAERTFYDSAASELTDKKQIPDPSCSHTDKRLSNKIIPAEDIKPEIEEGGKVLFLLGEDERIEGLKKYSKPDFHQPNYTEPSWVSLGPNHTPAIGFEKLENIAREVGDKKLKRSVTPPVEHSHSLITSLPVPVDVRRIVRTKYVGRESNLDLTTFEKENVVYPSVSELKLNSKVNSNVSGKLRKEMLKTHRRRHSDPTNGNCVVRLPVHCSQPLKDVLEEQVEGKDVNDRHTNGIFSKNDHSFNTSEGNDQMTYSEEIRNQPFEEDARSPEEICCLQMPRIAYANTPQRITCNNGAPAPTNSLAGSLFGGVLDHYSSVFVLHATTQTNQWEDSLRQDLFAASHQSTLDQQVSEAVAVVADTDLWEVQVVSSHSFIVERGGCGSQVGPRVGMSPLVSSITDSILDLARLSVDPQFIMQHLEERLCELYLKSQLLAEYLLGGTACGFGGSEASFSPYHLPQLTRALGLDLNDLPLLLAVASTHTPALTRMFGISFK